MSKLTIYRGINFVTGMDYNDIFNPVEISIKNTYGSVLIEKKPEPKRLSLIQRFRRIIQR